MSTDYNDKTKKNSRVIDDSAIVYNDGIVLSSFEEKMKKGYEYMAKINLRYSRLGIEYLLNDIDEYEACISGVWFIIWSILW